VLKQTGVWRLINPKADPWLDSPNNSPTPRRKSMPPKKARSSPIFGFDLEIPQQEFATSDPCASPTSQHRALSASAPQALPHISHLLRHVDDYWNSRSIHKSPPMHRRSSSSLTYSPYRSPPMESRFSSSSSTPSSPTVVSSPSPVLSVSSPTPNSPLPISPVAANQPTLPFLPPVPALSLDRVSIPNLHSSSPRHQGFPSLSPFPGSPQPIPLSPVAFGSATDNPLCTPFQSRGYACSSDVGAVTMQANMWMPSPSTRALHMLPCVSSLFQPSILPTS